MTTTIEELGDMIKEKEKELISNLVPFHCVRIENPLILVIHIRLKLHSGAKPDPFGIFD